jgi:hypothetical protein
VRVAVGMDMNPSVRMEATVCLAHKGELPTHLEVGVTVVDRI